MKDSIKYTIAGVIGWLGVQLLLLYLIQILWNLVMPELNMPEVSFIQITMLYMLFNLFRFDWFKLWKENSRSNRNTNA